MERYQEYQRKINISKAGIAKGFAVSLLAEAYFGGSVPDELLLLAHSIKGRMMEAGIWRAS